MKKYLLLFMTLSTAGLSLSCERSESDTREALVRPEPIGPAECAACGMVVAEQPAPRGQLVHRDGERRYFCSLGDLIHYLESPSPHGAPRGVFVEAVETSANPTSIDTRERRWIAAPAAVYLTGIERPHVMGPGLVAYSSAQAASEAAQRYGGRAAAWRELPPLVLRTQD